MHEGGGTAKGPRSCELTRNTGGLPSSATLSLAPCGRNVTAVSCSERYEAEKTLSVPPPPIMMPPPPPRSPSIIERVTIRPSAAHRDAPPPPMSDKGSKTD